METLDYTAPATLLVRQGGTDSTETGPLASMVERAMELHVSQRVSVTLELNGRPLGFGLIEAIYQRPDFPGRSNPGWLPASPRGASLASGLLKSIADATGLDLRREYSKAAVLVVEDDPIVRMIGTDLLADAGFDVFEAESADEAVHLLLAHPEIRLLFTDVNMPGSLDGVQLADWACAQRPGLKVLIGSGLQRPSPGALPACADFVPKPYRPEAIVERIRSLLAA
jgi:CheY-like chemotaxis protein